MKVLHFVIGRQPVPNNQEIPIRVVDKENNVSRKHCRITFENGNFYIEDLNSRNGTYVNDERIYSPTKINKHDHIRLGHFYNFSLNNPVINNHLKYQPDDFTETTSAKTTYLSNNQSLLGIGAYFFIILSGIILFITFLSQYNKMNYKHFRMFNGGEIILGIYFLAFSFLVFYFISLTLLTSYYRKKNIPSISSISYIIIVMSTLMIVISIIFGLNLSHMKILNETSLKIIMYIVILLQLIYTILFIVFGVTILIKDDESNISIQILSVSIILYHFLQFIGILFVVINYNSRRLTKLDEWITGPYLIFSIVTLFLIFNSIFAFYITQYELSKTNNQFIDS